MGLNVVLLGWSWARLLQKKSIAWTVMIIVIKYAVLLGSIYILAQESWFMPLGVALGIGSFVMAALLFGLFDRRKVLGKIGSF